MNGYYEEYFVVFFDEDGDIFDTVEFPTYEDAENYCMERDWTEVREGGIILYLDVKKVYRRI